MLNSLLYFFLNYATELLFSHSQPLVSLSEFQVLRFVHKDISDSFILTLLDCRVLFLILILLSLNLHVTLQGSNELENGVQFVLWTLIPDCVNWYSTILLSFVQIFDRINFLLFLHLLLFQQFFYASQLFNSYFLFFCSHNFWLTEHLNLSRTHIFF